jgi:hypothetical protein
MGSADRQTTTRRAENLTSPENPSNSLENGVHSSTHVRAETTRFRDPVVMEVFMKVM